MRLRLLLPLLPLAFAPPVRAQVTLDLHALDQNQPQAQQPAPEKRQPPPARKPAPHPVARRPAEQAKASPAPAKPASNPPAPMPAIPASPPPGVSLPPIVVQPTAAKPEQAPPPPPISDTAGGAVEPIQGGLRVLFSPERTDLTQGTEDAIKAYIASVPKTSGTSFNVIAYAAGPPEDPSTPRRLSLSRALAIRSVMIADGIDSPRIYVRALGATAGNGPPDRVDIAALGINAPGAQTPATATAEQPK